MLFTIPVPLVGIVLALLSAGQGFSSTALLRMLMVVGIAVSKPSMVHQAVWRLIVSRAERPDIELLVLGSHGYGTLERLLGTTAARVVNHTKRNVLIAGSPL